MNPALRQRPPRRVWSRWCSLNTLGYTLPAGKREADNRHSRSSAPKGNVFGSWSATEAPLLARTMKPTSVHYDFRIDALTPETLRLSRFVDYVDALRGIFDAAEDVYFHQVRKGSAVLEFAASHKAAPRIEKRLHLLGTAEMPADMAVQWAKINRCLRRDGASARLMRKGGKVTLAQFAGIRTPLAQEAIVHESGTLDGVVVGVKGVDDSVPIWLKTDDGALLKCNAKRDVARRLAPLFDCYVRVAGKGKWRRGDDARWTLEEFDIQSFDQLNEAPLEKQVRDIQAIADNGWNELEDAQAAWRELRAD